MVMANVFVQKEFWGKKSLDKAFSNHVIPTNYWSFAYRGAEKSEITLTVADSSGCFLLVKEWACSPIHYRTGKVFKHIHINFLISILMLVLFNAIVLHIIYFLLFVIWHCFLFWIWVIWNSLNFIQFITYCIMLFYLILITVYWCLYYNHSVQIKYLWIIVFIVFRVLVVLWLAILPSSRTGPAPGSGVLYGICIFSA